MNYCLQRIKYGPIFRFKHHLFDIRLHTLKQYNDLVLSKKYRLLVRLGLITTNYDSPIGIELWLSSTKDFDNKELDRLGSNNLKLLAKRCELHIFQKAKSQYGRRIGTFLGILVTHEDYYYILMDEYGNKWYETCVGKLEFIKN
jgi:hypothetical protein